MTARYRIDVAYDGTAYAGWQVQPNAVTIQERIEGAICRMTAERPKVHGSGRTDTGVHARRQVAHFDLDSPVAAASFQRGLNALLPPDIRVTRTRRVHAAFHARRDAVGKEYRYFIWNAEIASPFHCRFATHVRRKLDVAAMRRAAAHLVGRHDFAAFTANPNREVASTVRHLRRLEARRRGAQITIVAQADGFLYRMVRSLAGLLIRVGEGAVPPESARSILESRERTARVPTAPPQGLFLWNVSY
jgi:tRNA pseudouridine38-40 synthase